MDSRWIMAGLMAWLGTACAHRTAFVNLPAVLQPAMAKHPIREAFARQVRNAVDAGDGDAEVRELRRTLVLEPGNLEARLKLASLYEKLGFDELAVEHYRAAARQRPTEEIPQLLLAKCLRKLTLTSEAAAGFSKFLEQHPSQDGEMYAWLGILDDEAGLLPEGEEAHRQALRLTNGKKAYVFNNLGHNLLQQGKRDEAVVAFREALRLEPRNEMARNNLGSALALSPQQAILHFQSLTDPSTAHSNLAVALMELGRYPEARLELNIALGYNPRNQSALRNLGVVAELDGLPASIPLGKSKKDEAHAKSPEAKKGRSMLAKIFTTEEEESGKAAQSARKSKRGVPR